MFYLRCDSNNKIIYSHYMLFNEVDGLGKRAELGGYPDETLSSRMGKRQKCPVCRFVCKLLDLIDKDHCKKSVELDEGNEWNKH